MLVAFSGLKGSGKDTAASVLIAEYGFTKIAFADAVREVALIINPIITMQDGQVITSLSTVIKGSGWDWAKREIPEVRRLLQIIGTEAGRMILGENVWINLVAQRFPDIAKPDSRYVITDCRFPNEVDFVRDNGGCIIWIDRPGLESDGHASESTAIKDLATLVVSNNSSLVKLQDDIRFAMYLRRIDPID